jgi:hypothetical protein
MTSRLPSEGNPRAGESEDPEDKVTRGNFESLAKGLFGVSRASYEAEERKFRERESASKRKPS